MGAYAWSKIEIPRLRKRQHSAPGSLSQLSPREAERLRDGYDSTPDPAYSCLRCSAQRQTATWLLYRVLYSLLAAAVSAISLTLAPQCQAFH